MHLRKARLVFDMKQINKSCDNLHLGEGLPFLKRHIRGRSVDTRVNCCSDKSERKLIFRDSKFEVRVIRKVFVTMNYELSGILAKHIKIKENTTQYLLTVSVRRG